MHMQAKSNQPIKKKGAKMETKEAAPLLEVKGLKKYYPVSDSFLSKGMHRSEAAEALKAVDGVSFTIRQGETLGLVGESGCGKSTIGRQIVGLEKPTEGEIYFQGEEVSSYNRKKMRHLRTSMQMIFQDPYSSLNPRKRIYDILAQPMLYHKIVTRQEVEKEVDRLLELVGLSSNYKDRFPNEFSGGQRQRIGIARALSLRPKLIVCDEPVSALDVSIQAQILNLMRQLQRELNLTYLFIGHGLGAVKYISDRIAVMYLGKIVEIAPAAQLFENPEHPYTKALCDASPLSDPAQRDRERIVLQGDLPSPIHPPKGCRFHTRCPFASQECSQTEPALLGTGGHQAACIKV